MGMVRRTLIRVHRIRVAFAALLLLLGSALSGFGQPNPEGEFERSLLNQFAGLSGTMDDQKWRQEYGNIEKALDSVWRKNGWSSEADRFARNLACELAAIPPWDPLRRLEVFNDRVTARYGLKDERAAQFKGAMMREAAGFMVRNGGVILRQFQEGMKHRTAGEAFTSEQVARWTQQGRPMMGDLRETLDRLSREIEPLLDPEKQNTFHRDVQSLNKRQAYLDQMTNKWLSGQWQPDDWGLQDDPIQRKAMPSLDAEAAASKPRDAAAPQSSVAGAGGVSQAAVGLPVSPAAQAGAAASPTERKAATPRPTRAVPHDPPTWVALLFDMEQRFQLDGGQMNTAESIHSELFERAEQYIENHADELNLVPQRERMAHSAFEPVRELFTELMERLEAIPTSSQRQQAGEKGD